MNKKLLIGIMAVFIAVLAPGIVRANAEELVAEELMQTQVINESEDSTTESRQAERKVRVEGYKVKSAERLTAQQEKKIIGICKTSQLRLEKAQLAVATTLTKRKEKLDAVAQKLKDLEVKLQTASVDTTELAVLISTLETKTAEMLAGFEGYSQVLEDSSTLDCVSDPEGFKASIEVARTKRAEVKTMSQDIRKYVTDSVKTLLAQIKTSLVQSPIGSEE